MANVRNPCRKSARRARAALLAPAFSRRMEAQPPRRRIDEASKLLFLGEVITDLIRITLPALAGELDLDAVEPMPTEFIGMDRSRRIGDSAFRIPFAQRGEPAKPRYAIASGEFQDRNDEDMLARVREYTDRMLDAGRHQGTIDAGEQPLVLPFVIHTGAGHWRASDGMEALAELSPAAAAEVAPHQPQAYIAVDIGGNVPLPEGPPNNRFLAAARLVRSRSAETLLRQLRAEVRRFPSDQDRRFRAGLHAWAQEALLTLDPSGPQLPPLDEWESSTEADMPSFWEDRVRQWREDAIQEGERDALVRLAGRRFGGSASRRLADALDGHPTRELLTETGDLILTCETTEEFIRRLRNRGF